MAFARSAMRTVSHMSYDFENGEEDHRRARCLICGRYEIFGIGEFLVHVSNCGGKVIDYV